MLPVLLPGGAEENLVGREDVGRAVWERYEVGLKRWEEEEKALIEREEKMQKEKGEVSEDVDEKR